MKPGDLIVIAVVAVAAVLAWPITVLASAGGADAVTIEGPTGTSVLPLRPDRTIEVDGYRGRLVLEFSDGRARVASAPCPDHLCMRQGTVSSGGGAIVCAPNGVSVRSGRGDGALDAIVR